ncbi:MAG: cation diffusion facilitator family transporter [Clostridiales bacterium]|nr:cation diffusion facilitator family transporter [Clostridiales bacterium]
MPLADKTNNIRTAAIIALIGNAVLAALKIAAGIFSQSGALLSDGIDSSADVLISVITLAVVRIISKPADAEHPWGHGRAETIATAFLSFILFFMGGQLVIGCVSQIVSGEVAEVPSFIAVIITLVSIAGKILLALCQYILGKRADSAMIKANAKNMAGDVLISGGVLAGLVISNLTGSGYADIIIGGVIGIWIIKTALGIFLEANLELMDGNPNTEPYHVIIDAVNSVAGASNPHRARMRSVAGFWDIDFDIDVNPDCSISEAHDIASKVESEIKKRLENVLDIMIHVEPHGDTNDEIFGLSEDMMRNGKTE